MIVWIEHRAGIGGMATAGEAKVLAHGLPGNFATSIQDTGDDGGIKLRDLKNALTRIDKLS